MENNLFDDKNVIPNYVDEELEKKKIKYYVKNKDLLIEIDKYKKSFEYDSNNKTIDGTRQNEQCFTVQ